ncbi:flagellar filament capping protein FliD [Larsenimonas suaedae]|uniref:Flagellar hook-associated protein 2 n=1 Tax=Larsenimonas suaedae TaxID=1851019 RepID=A0ABU1GXM9_9GAMM|nr:flagellar filament capping protein FliD [Larsenimonas suaedae]MCM2971549.1 flagellar filament capping protein FliD [Larsenimonas suaedae]MDR5896805.1 flagellar filament capping protein FliD [Larsenimonas suaedae]
MASISSLGVGAGLDLGSLLNQLQSAERSRLAPIATQQNSYNAKLTGYGKLSSALESFQTAAKALGDPSLYQSKSAASESTAFSAALGENAQEGSYSVKVNRLATAQSLATTGQASRTDTIGTGDAGKLTITVGDKTTEVVLGSDNSSLEGIRDAINGSDAGVTASIINDGSGTPHRLVLSSETTGESSQITTSFAYDSLLATDTTMANMLNYDSADKSGNLIETVAAQNAEVVINGLTVTSNTNTVEEAIQGVTLSLTETNETAETLSVSQDKDTIKGAFEELVSSYNALQKVIDTQTKFDAENGRNGALFGESSVRNMQVQIRGAFNTSTEGTGFNYMAQIGVSLNSDGELEIDSDKLDKAIASDSAGVAELMAGADGESGVAGIMTSTMDRILGDDGLIDSVKDNINNRLDSLSKRYDQVSASIDATVSRYRKQFNDLDVMMSSINSTSNYLSQQFSAMNAQSGQ